MVKDVSIRARHLCRANPICSRFINLRPKVSIRARHLCQANRQDYYLLPGAAKFESAPDISVGRTPGPETIHGGTGVVSIRARHLCRANRGRYPTYRHRSRVSIRARHLCRANHPDTQSRLAPSHVSIRARHLCRANHLKPGRVDHMVKFQSAPDISVGRTHVRLLLLRPKEVSIPRPTSLSGERQQKRPRFAATRSFQSAPDISVGRTYLDIGLRLHVDVSIRARHLCRANRGTYNRPEHGCSQAPLSANSSTTGSPEIIQTDRHSRSA